MGTCVGMFVSGLKKPIRSYHLNQEDIMRVHVRACGCRVCLYVCLCVRMDLCGFKGSKP